MPKYLFKVSYSVEGAGGVLKDGGSGRADAIRKALESLGGTYESFHFALGEDDGYLIADLPDAEAVTALSIAVAAAGGARVKSVPLLTVQQVDEAVKRSFQYRPPGG